MNKTIEYVDCPVNKGRWLVTIFDDKSVCQNWLPVKPTRKQINFLIKEFYKTIERWEEQWEMYQK